MFSFVFGPIMPLGLCFCSPCNCVYLVLSISKADSV
jgi:hypothetical protein